VCLQGIEAHLPAHNRALMLDSMASPWTKLQQALQQSLQQTLQRRIGKALGPNVENLVFNEGPKIISQGIRLGLDMITRPPETAKEITAGRPVTKNSVPTAYRARKIVYSPDLDGRADPGEIVWTWVVYEDDPSQGTDRPVLVVGRDRNTLLGLMLSSQQHHSGDRNWVGIGTGSWDYDGRVSWVRLDRVLDVPEEGIRREGAILEQAMFDKVAARLRADHSWS
jgi:PemK-like, MazF-like toxin of type II toxin-antitoxin system